MSLGLGSLKKQAGKDEKSAQSSQADDIKKLQEQMAAKAEAGDCPFC